MVSSNIFSKEKAIQLMLDGCRIIESASMSKRQYQGEYCTYVHSKFQRIEYKNANPLDTNQMINKYWTYAEIVPKMIPHRVYKTDLRIGVVITLDYVKILKQDIDRDKNLWAIVQYTGSDGKDYTVKMTHKEHPSISRKLTLQNHIMYYDQDNIYDEKKTANFVLKCFVEEETEKQKKRHKSKKELETMETVRAIITNYPEVLV